MKVQSFAPRDIPPIDSSLQMQRLLRRVPLEEIPDSSDILSAAELQHQLERSDDGMISLLAVGDIMLGGRSRRVIAARGVGYPFEAVMPLLNRASVVMGNLEGPFARMARRQERNFAYRMNPALAKAIAEARIGVLTLANNHLMDCGRTGVLETLAALDDAGIAALGAGINRRHAHEPVIRQAGGLRIGMLGYYWNHRCGSRTDDPGCAVDSPEALAEDIGSLRRQVDRVVVTFHWGVPYLREPWKEDRAKARLAIDCGADAVVGHHPHIIQAFEIYRERPILYSIGNFTFGSANSRAEGLMVGFGFEDARTVVRIFPLYVKNRDPRIDYRPAVLSGASGERILRNLAAISGSSGARLRIVDQVGEIECRGNHRGGSSVEQ
jgi:poly-gamma-glutamate capsule biosynthesis protein CapA/YwtB (metallophosphatase superfamily)